MNILFVCALIAVNPAVGSTAFDFLRISPTAREVALGSFNPAGSTGAFAFYYNPAQILNLSTPEGQFSYVNYPAGINAGSAAYAQHLSERQGIGAGLYYLNSGTMKRTNEQGEELGTFGASYADLSLAGAVRITDPLIIGLSIAGLYGNIDTFFSLGVIASAGAVYSFSAYHLQFGFTARHLGLQVKPFGDYRDPLPAEFALGAGWQPVPPLFLGFGVIKPLDDRFRFSFGLEGWVSRYLVLRGGYNSQGADWSDTSAGGLIAGFTAGLGIHYDRYQIDYAFVPMGRLGFSHRLSFGFSL
ncbi:MAG: PorV/PorQ family protein [candidate division WOR-3 bacterium]|jgi:hypothetical protein